MMSGNLEILNVVVALKMCGHCWANRQIRIHCDNLAVVEIFIYDRDRSPIARACLLPLYQKGVQDRIFTF